MPFSSRTSRAVVTHCTMFSASFRHGITTDTRNVSSGASSSACNSGVMHVRDNQAGAQLPTVLSVKSPGLRGGWPARRGLRFAALRICIVYDRLPPHTVGGAEEWYKNLSERLAVAGHEVTYLTLRHWVRGQDPGVSGVHVAAY